MIDICIAIIGGVVVSQLVTMLMIGNQIDRIDQNLFQIKEMMKEKS